MLIEYLINKVSKLNIAISILPDFIDNIVFCWEAKDGTIVKTSDEQFDEENLVCWIEGLKPKLYWDKAYTKKIDHPFLIPNLPYDLDVLDYGTLMSFTIETNEISNATTIINSVTNLIDSHNDISLSKERKNGIIHNYYHEITNTSIIFRIDLGSAGIIIIKKILKQLSKYSNIKKVILDL